MQYPAAFCAGEPPPFHLSFIKCTVIVALDHEARLHDDLFRAMLEELMIGRLAAGRLVDKGS
jgi:hypothetical protein